MRGFDIVPVVIKVCIAAGLMGMAVWFVMVTVQQAMGTVQFLANAVTAVTAALIGFGVYLLMTTLLRVKELAFLRGLLQRKAR